MVTTRLIRPLAGAFMALMLASGGAQAQPTPAAFDGAPYVNPELLPLYRVVQSYFASAPPPTRETLAAQRKLSPSAEPQRSPAWEERTVPGPRGAPDLRVYVINPGAPGQPLRPAILHMHGGGFVAGVARSDIRRLQDIALALDCVIVTVDYRLAPETPFPGSLEDNYAGLKWLHANAAQLGVDPKRIALMGESAGGGHAAMLAIAARDRGEVPIAFEALIYPMLDDRTGSTQKTQPYQGMVVWTPQQNRFGWTSLLGVPAGSAHVPEGAVPARTKTLSGLPPTFIGVGSIDLFAEEDLEYAKRLIDAGVPVSLDVVPGAFHGFNLIGQSPIAVRFNAAVVEALRDGLQVKR